MDRVLAGREDAAAETSFRGTALFADITDYTDLAEGLCEQGSTGVERLAQFLDRAFRRYVDCVRETGGEVACFAGDALLAYWPDADDRAGLASAQHCARLLHNASLIDALDQARARTLHIGIGTGRLWAARLGGLNARWHLLLAGAAVRAASAAAARAAPGETCVVEPVAAPGVAESPAASNTYRASPTQSSGLRTDAFVPRVVKDWVGEGLEDWLPQIRSVCALIMRIDGPDSDHVDALRQHQAAVNAAMTAIQPYTSSGGTLVFDDKGLTLKLCLGLPHDSHVDDALRAVAAGLAIEREFRRLGIRCAGGLASGRGVCMPIGGPGRQDYVAVGRFMHVAARLMQCAGEGLLCTDEIAERVRGEFTLSPEGRVELKGVRGSLRPFRVRDIPHRAERAERLFGREFERKQLEGHLQAAAKGKGRTLWLVGEAGIGKTALVRQFVKTAQQAGLSCLVGGAPSVDNAVPYLAWRPIFSALLQTADGAPSAVIDGLLARMRHPKLAPLVNAVLPGFMEETEFVKNLSGDARADATSRILSEIIELRAARPIVLVLEDCHWLDSASWRLLLRIAQDCADALVVLTSRPAIQSRELDALRRLDTFLEIAVSPLRKDAVVQLVQDLLEVDVASAELIDDIVDRSACNPLFIREYTLLLDSARRGGGYAGGNAPLSPAARDETLPGTVEGLIASRLDSLTPEEHWVLKAASVLGDQFQADLLTGVCADRESHPDLGATLASLVRGELLVEAGSNSSRFAFRHTLIRAGAYEQLTVSQRTSLHRAAAATIERLAGDPAPYAATLAHHWLKAQVPERGVVYADRAASQALAAGAYLEADRLLSECVALNSQVPNLVQSETPIRWLRQIAEARRGTGQLESRAAAARQALALAGRWRPRSRAALAVQGAARAVKLSVRHLLPSLRPRPRGPLTLEIAQGYRHSAEVCYFNNDMVGMICDSISSVDFAERAPPSAVLASASTELGGVLAIAGFRWVGERILRRAIAVAATAGDQAALAYAHLVSALYAVGTGDWAGADRSARFCQELCEPMDDAVNWTNAQAIRFWLAHYQGHHAAAAEAAQELHDRAQETGNRQHQAWALRYLAQCDLRRNRPAEAAARLGAALECLGETAALNERIPAIALLALARLQMGEVWAARAKAGDGLALIAQVKRPIGHGVLEGYSAIAEVVLEAWRTDPAASNWRRDARRCLRVLRKYRSAFPIGAARYWLWQGKYYELAGRQRAARASYSRGAAAAAGLGMVWEHGRCTQGLADLSR